MVQYFAPIDYVFIIAYFVVLIWIGYKFSRKQSDDDYLIGERKLGAFSTMTTMNASKIGAIPMIFVALVYAWGLSAVWFFIGVILGWIIFVPFALHLKGRSDERYYTLAHYFKHKSGRKVASLVSLFTILIMLILLLNNLIAGTKIFSFFTGSAFWLSALIMISVVLAYLLLAGYKAVAKTDTFQFSAMLLILAILAVLLFKGTIIPSSDLALFAAGPPTIVGFFIAGVFFPFASPELWQRVYSAKNKKALLRGMVLSISLYAVFAALLTLLALTVKAQFPTINPDIALIHGFANLLPAGLLGLSIILLFAAVMSSIDTYVFTAASSIVQDFYEGEKRKIVKHMRKTIFLLSIIMTGAAILLQDLIIASFILVAFMTILGMGVIASWIKPTIKQRTLIIGLIVGLIGLFGFLITSFMKGEVTPIIVIVSLASSVIGLIIGWIVSLIR